MGADQSQGGAQGAGGAGFRPAAERPDDAGHGRHPAAPQGAGDRPEPGRHHHDGPGDDPDRRGSDEGRRLRLRAEALQPAKPAADPRPRHGRAPAAHGKRAPAAVRRAAHLRVAALPADRLQPGDAARRAAHRKGGADRRDGAGPRRRAAPARSWWPAPCTTTARAATGRW